jgi:hypothetical protein
MITFTYFLLLLVGAALGISIKNSIDKMAKGAK